MLREGAPAAVIENVRVSLSKKTLRVATGKWTTTSQSSVGYPHFGKLRMNVAVRPTYQERLDRVAPHGILGQTYDRDQLPLHGRRDNYSRLDDGRLTASRTGFGGVVTTRAQAEGAIEGDAEDYRMASDFATDFRFSRFDAVAAAPRNTTALRRGGRMKLRPYFPAPHGPARG